MNTEVKYWPADRKLLARITNSGRLVCIFKAPPTDKEGHAMAKALTNNPTIAAEQRIAELTELLQQVRKKPGFFSGEFVLKLDAALNPKPESGRDEPQCLLCLDKKTVPVNIPGGFVKDCPDCCGEEG